MHSREDLYEQNMHTKIEVNGLRNENRKINTKLLVLENQLAQKDKLFEDMYRAAFQQPRHPPINQGYGNHQGQDPSVGASKPLKAFRWPGGAEQMTSQ